MGPSAFRLALEYIDWQEQKQDSEGEKTTDVFTAGTPGALSLKDLEREVDLGQWKLKLGQRLVNLEVKSTSYFSTWSLRMLLIGGTETSWLGRKRDIRFIVNQRDRGRASCLYWARVGEHDSAVFWLETCQDQ